MRTWQDHDDVDGRPVLERAGLDPTAVIGGRLSAFSNAAWARRADYWEADESDRSFLTLSLAIALVTNIDREHMDAWQWQALEGRFLQFINKVPVARRCSVWTTSRARASCPGPAAGSSRDLRMRTPRFNWTSPREHVLEPFACAARSAAWRTG